MPEPITRAQDTVSLDSSPTMAMTTLYGAAVGPIGKDYYLPIFSRFEAAGQATLSWNLSACLYTINWMIFRRLWGPALVFAGALLGSAVLLVALGLLVLDWPHELLYQLLLACLGFSMLASGLWGNALLYNHCRQAMMTAVADNKTLVQACAQLSQQASTRQRFIRLLLANALLLTLAGLAYLRWVGWDGTDTPVPDSTPAPALAASAIEPAAPAASQAASVALAPASATSTPLEVPALLAAPVASAASATPASAAVSAAASAPPAMPASAPVSVPAVLPATFTQPPASAALVASALPQAAASALERTASAPRGRSAAPASVHSSAAAPSASKPAARAASKPAARASKPVAKVASAKAPKTTAAKASQVTKAAPPTKGLYINAGLFANPDNARNALAKLQAAGLPATAQEIDTSQGPRTRIRVGPYVKTPQAEASIQKIKALGLDAALVKP
ncbi:SPOR domain-containing protein [Rhodoferax sp. U11-2br]|uniref:SPOR domain-containing protein n=1 Tax=Rhodoferax sp. U11-2br TaxID=2838878 RepID=UPI001BE8AF1D|nr:SPOR domain-containing protein [Rhodoferax sp. U11-2br]MBT3066829.1 SPOR domain-containing protein [Rhodoferax sp. U11-2br]